MNASSPACDHWRETIRLQVCDALTPQAAAALRAHLAACAHCRQYARELQSATAGLRALAATPIEPSPRLRSRWTTAVHQAAQPASAAQMLAELLQWCQDFLRRNRRPLFALAPVWLLILALRLTVPPPAPVSTTTLARSPLDILRALKTQEQLMAGQSDLLEAARPLPPRPTPPPPRSDIAPRSPLPGRAATRAASFQPGAVEPAPRQLAQLAATRCL